MVSETVLISMREAYSRHLYEFTQSALYALQAELYYLAINWYSFENILKSLRNLWGSWTIRDAFEGAFIVYL